MGELFPELIDVTALYMSSRLRTPASARVPALSSAAVARRRVSSSLENLGAHTPAIRSMTVRVSSVAMIGRSGSASALHLVSRPVIRVPV
jgi:hypothetical protein